MFSCKYINLKSFLVFLVSGLILMPTSGQAGQGLKAMAEAQQNAYLEVRKLGEKATPNQIAQISRSVSADANKKLADDHSTMFKSWRSILRKKHDQIAAEHESQVKKQLAAGGGKVSADRLPASDTSNKRVPSVNNAIRTRDAKSDTGSYEGEGTVSVIDFSKKK